MQVGASAEDVRATLEVYAGPMKLGGHLDAAYAEWSGDQRLARPPKLRRQRHNEVRGLDY
jgi:hypothetical protein